MQTSTQYISGIHRTLKSTGISCLAAGLCLFGLSAHGVEVGPRVSTSPGTASVEPGNEKRTLPKRLGIPDLTISVPVLDPNIPADTAQQTKKDIWPELRKAEAVRYAVKIAGALEQLNQFETVIVSPDTTVSAHLYLLGRIDKSNSEDLAIRYQLVDASGAVWIPEKTVKHRVLTGWHERNEQTSADPFNKVYQDIASSVYRELRKQVKTNQKQIERNKSLIRKGKSVELTDFERLVAIRSLSWAAYIDPEQYGDALQSKNGIREIQYLPTMMGIDWTRSQSVLERDKTFHELLHSQYTLFSREIEHSYKLWQRDTFPFARGKRIADSKSKMTGVLAVAALAGGIHAATGGTGMSDRKAYDVARAAALANAALATASVVNKNKRDRSIDEINELSKSIHNALRPTRIELESEVISLTGTAQEQTTQWRELLTRIYQNEGSDIEAVRSVQVTEPKPIEPQSIEPQLIAPQPIAPQSID